MRVCERLLTLSVLTLVLATMSPTTLAQQPDPAVVTLVRVLAGSPYQNEAALRKLGRSWEDGYVAPLAEILRLNKDRELEQRIVSLLKKKTGRRFGNDYQRWQQWLWGQPYAPIENYAVFKSWLYGNLDPRFKGYFSNAHPSSVRLDEVVWGGVTQDGIPPLRSPRMILSQDADYLGDDNLVFGIEINGDARAYPKRVMGWHEMFVDVVGGVDIVGVYCTLCGSMIIYYTRVGDELHEMGTSGFLYRSNKLMYDKATQSLWNSFWGRPVVGPLVGKNIELKRGSVVTTTWKGWRQRHPASTVLALPTDYDVDYGEGVAYRDYYSSDKLMFRVPKLDDRLKNKAEVFGINLAGAVPVALAVQFLAEHPLYEVQVGEQDILILTDSSGAIRAFEGGVVGGRWDQKTSLIDAKGTRWTLSEQALTSDTGTVLRRLPGHRAFWFGWYSAFENTRLIH